MKSSRGKRDGSIQRLQMHVRLSRFELGIVVGVPLSLFYGKWLDRYLDILTLIHTHNP